MRRMITDKEFNSILFTPSEANKIYCNQFVADTIVINNLPEGNYAIQLIDNSGDNVETNLLFFNFKYESTYGVIVGSYFYNDNMAQIIALKGEYSANSKTITLSIIDTNGNTIQSPNSIHIDIYKTN